MIGFAALALTTLAAASIVYFTVRLGIGPLPTSRGARRAMLGLCDPAQTGTVYELGSGWGGLARGLANRCPNAQVIGIEASLLPWALSVLVQRLAPMSNLRFVHGDFRAQPLEQADLLVCYLFTDAMRALVERRRFKPGAALVSSTFALPGHTAEQTVRAADLYGSPVYRYRL